MTYLELILCLQSIKLLQKLKSMDDKIIKFILNMWNHGLKEDLWIFRRISIVTSYLLGFYFINFKMILKSVRVKFYCGSFFT
ncbi:hypothetical protein GCM10025861_06360 [Methanobacterium petrolearium]|nr:hypothetical protein GCM10025861_06360 [Methanobacterium petrolearium]